jgi:hypothetical protein
VTPDRRPEWHREVLPPGWSAAVRRLTDRSALSGFYLAGGTGLALQRGHRRSVDLDLFREPEFDPAEVRNRLRGLEGLRNLETAPGTLHLLLDAVKVSFLHYPYPLLFPLLTLEGLPVGDERDIACMKLDAIAGRGSRRDFVDLYVVARAYGLRQILDWFGRKFAAVSYSRVHLLKSLTYFADAEHDPPPDMLVPVAWPAVEEFFLTEVPKLAPSR